MALGGKFIHRGRRLAAKIYRAGRKVAQELTRPSDTETLMASLPVVETAGPGLDGKVVVISGSTQGVGLVVARAFARRGARIVVNGRRAEAVDGAVKSLSTEGHSVAGVLADVATQSGVETLLKGAVDAFGTIDIVINNAAIAGPYAPIWKTGPEALEETVRINLTGPILCARQAIDWFLSHSKQGRIINLSSISTEGDYPNFTPYSTTKAGLDAFTRYAAADLPGAEVIITSLVLPGVRTERKAAVDWASAELMAPAESLLPAFEFCATGPASHLHGRTLSAARFTSQPEAEARLASVASVRQQILYPELEIGGREVARDPRKLVLLDRAENQHGTSPMALQAIAESLNAHQPAYYPDERFLRLRTALAREHGLAAENFALGPGSWELIARSIQLFAKPGEEVISNGPGWFGFNVTCQRWGIAQKLVPLERGETGNRPSHNLAAIAEAVTPRTRMIYLISPSNPEGVALHHAEVREFLRSLPPELPVMIDEAYSEYANDPDMVKVAELVREGHKAVIGLRTFSKFYAMAGLRVGYAFGHPDLIDLIRRSEQIFTLAHVAEVAAVAALEDAEHRRRVFDASVAARDEMQRRLSEMGIWHIPSQASYIFARAPKNYDAIIEELAGNGIIVPPYRFHDGQMIMLPIGSEEQNARILDTIRAHL